MVTMATKFWIFIFYYKSHVIPFPTIYGLPILKWKARKIQQFKIICAKLPIFFIINLECWWFIQVWHLGILGRYLTCSLAIILFWYFLLLQRFVADVRWIWVHFHSFASDSIQIKCEKHGKMPFLKDFWCLWHLYGYHGNHIPA